MDEVIERISALEGRVSEHDRIFDMIREEIRGLREYIDGRIDDTNTRIDDLRLDMNGRIDGINKRIDETNKRIDETNKRIDETNRKIEEMDIRLNRRIDSNFKWMLGIQIAMWITIISATLIPLNHREQNDGCSHAHHPLHILSNDLRICALSRLPPLLPLRISNIHRC